MTTSRPAGSRSFSLTDIIGVAVVAGGLATLFTTLLASTVLRPIVVVNDAPAPPGSAPAGAAPSASVVTAPSPAPSPTVNPDGSWPAVRREREVAVTRADKLEVVRVERIASEDPFWAAWTQAPFVVVPLIPQQMAMPRAEAASIQELRVQGLTDGRTIAWRIGWDDATPDGNVDTGRFSDAVAIGFPLDPGAPPMMGARGLRVQILYWKALWQKDADAGFQDVQSLHPNYWSDLYWFAEGQFPYPVPSAFQLPASRQWFIAHQAGNPMAAFSRTQPIEELVAEGWSTLTHQPQSATSGRGAWVDGKWAVVFVRPLRTTDPLDYTFSTGGKGQAVFAGWNGSAGNRGGRKQWSTWVDFEVGP